MTDPARPYSVVFGKLGHCGGLRSEPVVESRQSETDPARLDTQGSEEVPDDRDPVAVALRWLIAAAVAGAFVLGFLAGRDGGWW